MSDRSYYIRFDDDAGPVERPFALLDGRTVPSVKLDLVSLVRSSGHVPENLDPGLTKTLSLCVRPTAVAEVAARLGRPVVVAKIFLSDLIEQGAVIALDGLGMPDLTELPPQANIDLMERLLDGLHNLAR